MAGTNVDERFLHYLLGRLEGLAAAPIISGILTGADMAKTVDALKPFQIQIRELAGQLAKRLAGPGEVAIEPLPPAGMMRE